MTRRPDREAGSVSLLVLAGGFVLLATTLVVLSAVTDVAVAAARARTAADAAALAAVAAGPPIGDPCDAAREVAQENGAALLRCDPDRVPVDDPLGAGVEVEVEVEPGTALASSLTGPLPARAAAALAPD